MKKFLIVFAASLVVLACKKQYKCVCTNDGVETPNVYLDRFNKSEADAEKIKCETDTTCYFKQGN
jgi:hypothetical protein